MTPSTEILGVGATATSEEIRAAHRRVIQSVHPDRGGPDALFRQVQEAYETLSNPERRAAYDRILNERSGKSAGGADDNSGWERVNYPPPPPRNSGNASNTGSGPAGAPKPPPPPGPGKDGPQWVPPPPSSASGSRGANSGGVPTASSFISQHPVAAVALAGVGLLILGSIAGRSGGGGLGLLGVVVLLVAVVALLGRRGANEREAYQRSGMPAVDAMTGTQFEILLEHLFAYKGYRVARVGGRGDFGADLLLDDATGRTIVPAKRWTGVVRHEAIQEAVAAKAHYGAVHAMVVTQSTFSQHATTLARSNNVVLWDRPKLAAELAQFGGQPSRTGAQRLTSELRAGSRVALGIAGSLLN
jgi:hypothetical protein